MNKVEKAHAAFDRGIDLIYNTANFAEAEKQFSEVIKYDKNNYEAYYYRGCVMINTQRYKEAIADFEKAIALKPDYADAYFNMGRTYYLMHDEDKACENYKLAAKYGRPNLEDYIKRCNW